MLDQPTGMSFKDMTYQRATAYANACSRDCAVAVADAVAGCVAVADAVAGCVAVAGAVAVDVGGCV